MHIDVVFCRYPSEPHLLRVVTVESSAESAASGNVRNHPIDQMFGVRQIGCLLGCLVQCQECEGRPSDIAGRTAILSRVFSPDLLLVIPPARQCRRPYTDRAGPIRIPNAAILKSAVVAGRKAQGVADSGG